MVVINRLSVGGKCTSLYDFQRPSISIGSVKNYFIGRS